jgi:flagella basal body P-ring formation protein FlgA
LALPDSIEVHASTVRVADLVPGPVPEAAAGVVVVAGGRPGVVIVTTARAVLRRLAMAGAAEGVTMSGAERCRIRFAGGEIAPDMLSERITELLQANIPAAHPDAPPSWLELELGGHRIMASGAWEVSWPQPRTLTPGRNLLTVAVRTGESSQRLSLVAILHSYGRVAVPLTPVSRGQSLDPEAMRWQWVDLSQAAAGLVTDPDYLCDMQIVRDIEPGQVLSKRDLAPRPLVRRGEMIDLIMRRGGVEAVLRVECRQDGLMDQTISVRNTLNNSLVLARVAGPGIVTMGR